MTSWHRVSLSLGTLVLVSFGCRSEPIEAPFVDARQAAEAALAQYDVDKSGYLETSELEKAPGINAAVEMADSNRDTKLSKDEMATRIKKFVGDEVGMMAVDAVILYDGQPVKDAEVKFIPEPCLGSAFLSGSGKTNAQGRAAIKMDNDSFPGLQCGWFRVEVSLKDKAGRDFLPAKYNTNTILGAEVALDDPNLERGLKFELKSEPKAKK